MSMELFPLTKSKQPDLSGSEHQIDSERLNFPNKSEMLGYSPSEKCNDRFHISNNIFFNRRVRRSKSLGHNPATTRQFFGYCDSNNPVIPKQLSFYDKYFNPRGTEPLSLLEHVKSLLQQGNINNARRALELGSILYPWSRKISKLLVAITPGQVLQTGETTTGRKKEFKWMKEHRDEYRGQWVALDGDRLIGSAPTLKKLLAKASSVDQQGRPAFVHYFMPE